MCPMMLWALCLGCPQTNIIVANWWCDAGSLGPAACDRTCCLAETCKIFLLLLGPRPAHRPHVITPMWQWFLLRSCGRWVCQSAGNLVLDQNFLLPWGLWCLTASFRTVQAPQLQLQLLGLWAPFPIDSLACCCHTMPITDVDDATILLCFSCADVTFELANPRPIGVYS